MLLFVLLACLLLVNCHSYFFFLLHYIVANYYFCPLPFFCIFVNYENNSNKKENKTMKCNFIITQKFSKIKLDINILFNSFARPNLLSDLPALQQSSP